MPADRKYGVPNPQRRLLLIPVAFALLGSPSCSIHNERVSERSPPPVTGVAPTPRAHGVGFSLGAGYWPAAGELSPGCQCGDEQRLGSIESLVKNIELDYAHRVTEVGPAALWVGVNLGHLSSKGKIQATVFATQEEVSGSLDSSMGYFATSARLSVPVRSDLEAFAGIGAGYYAIRIEESFTGRSVVDRTFTDSSVGGYLSIGFDFSLLDSGFYLRMENKLHFFHFAQIEELAPDDDELDGPVEVLQLGLFLRF